MRSQKRLMKTDHITAINTKWNNVQGHLNNEIGNNQSNGNSDRNMKKISDGATSKLRHE